MNIIAIQPASAEIIRKKYMVKDANGNAVDNDTNSIFHRIAEALASKERAKKKWASKFEVALQKGAIVGGRIMANAGAEEYKPATSTINCTVAPTIGDSMDSILKVAHDAAMTLKAGCGIGYEFSTLRPKGAFVSGAGASTSGPLSFMDIFDSMCKTVSSAGGRRGAQMGTFSISHPDIYDFIRAKRKDGTLRHFNLSCLITSDFMEAVKHDDEWKLSFKASGKELADDSCEIIERDGEFHRVYKTVKARDLWNVIMRSTYEFADPGFILIDTVNEMNNNWFCENIRATNPLN